MITDSSSQAARTGSYKAWLDGYGSAHSDTLSQSNAASGYTQKSFSLGSFAGSTVTLKFTGVEDAPLQTSFVVDDTAVTTG